MRTPSCGGQDGPQHDRFLSPTDLSIPPGRVPRGARAAGEGAYRALSRGKPARRASPRSEAGPPGQPTGPSRAPNARVSRPRPDRPPVKPSLPLSRSSRHAGPPVKPAPALSRPSRHAGPPVKPALAPSPPIRRAPHRHWTAHVRLLTSAPMTPTPADSSPAAGAGRKGPLLFFSDVHLGVDTDSGQRLDWLLELCHRARDRAAGVYILGDLFDFWFEYRRAVPKGHFRLLRGLAEIVDAGVPVTFLAGNHDFWVGSYLKSELGLAIFDEPITRELQDRRVYLAHGDGLGPGDTGYRIMKKVLRHPVAIALYRLLHPDLGIPLAHRVSAVSRRHTLAREVLLARIHRDIAVPLFQAGHDAVMIGHVHEPAHIREEAPAGSRDFIVLGDWMKSFTFAEMEGGKFRLYRWNAAGDPILVPSEDAPPAGSATRS
ncbi:MAG: hypothetical protein GF355_13225 [Candidatus Eisenbacteria bacterium]|nr:hypothetical protein [Candidatus Eisenbacteria bacterium]